MASFSIKRRIVVAVIATELVLVVCLLFLAILQMRRNAFQSFDAALHGRAMSVAALVRYSEGPHPELQFDKTSLPRPLTQDVPDLYRIEMQGGRVLASSGPSQQLSTGPRLEERVWNFKQDGISYRALILPDVPLLDSEEEVPKDRIKLIVAYAAGTQEMAQSLLRSFLTLLFGGVVLLAISAFVSIRWIERGLSPLVELAASANTISATNWDLKLSPSTTNVVEIAPLTRALSRMIDTLHGAFQQQRDFTSNAAHELKTPVAILKSTLQSLLQEHRTDESYRAGIADALSDVDRLETLLHSMLRLARADLEAGGAAPSQLSNVDVVGTCESAVARLATLAQGRGTKISLVVSNDKLIVRAEPEDLEIVWANLIENAIRYGPPDSEVKVSATRRNGFVSVAVEDSGPGIATSELSKIFERFHRGDQSRSRDSGGYGLGLAIAKGFVERYGGSITASSLVLGGTRISVELPVSNHE
jgi:signal transduction histidine kinase